MTGRVTTTVEGQPVRVLVTAGLVAVVVGDRKVVAMMEPTDAVALAKELSHLADTAEDIEERWMQIATKKRAPAIEREPGNGKSR